MTDRGVDEAGRAFEREVFGPLARKPPGNTAQAVAALLDLGAVCVEYTIGRQCIRVVRRFHPHQLVETGARRRIAKAFQHAFIGHFRIPLALIDDEDPVARTVHFQVAGLHAGSVDRLEK